MVRHLPAAAESMAESAIAGTCRLADRMALFITFEGLDGSGKSTHLKRAASWLARHRVPHRVTQEPGGTPLGGAIREVFLARRFRSMDGVVELLLVFASRRAHLAEVIEPTLASGIHVLCDRFTDSTYAYQGFGRGVDRETIAAAERLATGGRKPDRTLLFDLPAAAARDRGHSNRRRRHGAIDRLDAEELAFYQRVRDGYLTMAAQEPARFRVLSSEGDAEDTAKQVRAALDDLLAGAR